MEIAEPKATVDGRRANRQRRLSNVRLLGSIATIRGISAAYEEFPFPDPVSSLKIWVQRLAIRAPNR